LKIIATILLISFGSFLMETVMLPNKTVAASKAVVGKCCGQCKMMKQHAQQQKENTNNSCNHSCLNCPVFAIFYGSHIKNDSFILAAFISHYVNFEDRFISSYVATAWKPPNRT
jgi:hypothetical protein